jgi:ABC-type phosphate transport system ATPase subunit
MSLRPISGWMKLLSTLLEIKNIETYYDLIYALRGVSLSLEEKTITAILGNNGAGKSTIYRSTHQREGYGRDRPDGNLFCARRKRDL